MTRVEEPEWDPRSRALALAVDRSGDGLCPCGCGIPAVVAHDPENEGRFAAEPPIRCFARTALLIAQERYAGEDVKHSDALLWTAPQLPGQQPRTGGR